MRRQVNRQLSQRPALEFDEWFATFWQEQGISRKTAAFVYTKLEDYSGLNSARLQPSDRLIHDLQLPAVCWFDWQLTLCEDFHEHFGVDISECQELLDVSNLAEFVEFLDGQTNGQNACIPC